MTRQWERPQRDHLDLPIVAASLVGVALVLAREATYGVNWHYDAVYYVSVAANVLAGEGLVAFDWKPQTNWPPLFPLALVLASGFGIFDPADVVGPLNIATHGLTIFVVGNYLRQRLQSRPLVVWACFAVALSSPLADVVSTPLAEPLFTLLTTLALIQTHRLLTQGDKSALFLAAAFSAFAWQTRYLGVALPVAVGLFLLFQRRASWQLRARHLVIYSTIVALPMGIWLLRNHLLAGEPLSPWGDSKPSLFPSEAIDTVLAWLDFDLPLAPEPNSLTPFLNVGVPLAVVATGLFIAAMRPQGYRPFDWRPCWLFGGFALAYLATLNIASMLGYWDEFQDRWVAPLWVPLAIAVTFALDWLIGWATADKRRPLFGFGSTRRQVPPKLFVGTLGAALVLWSVDQAMHNAYEIRRDNSFAQGKRIDFSNSYWLRSETSRYIRLNPLHGTVFSNIPSQVYLNNTGKPKYSYVLWDRPPYESAPRISRSVAEWPASETDGTYLVLYRTVNPDYYRVVVAAAKIAPALVQVANLADGAIFQVERSHVPPNPYRQAHRAIALGMAGNPSSSVFDVYRAGRALTYFKQPCLPEDTETPFFLQFTTTVAQLTSEATDAVPSCLALEESGEEGHVADGGFNFWQFGTMLDDDTCVAIARLPGNVPICHLWTGQALDGIVWTVEPDVADLHGAEYSATLGSNE